MAHIPDGLLAPDVLIAGSVAAALGVGLALRGLDERAVPRIALLSAVFFTASLVSVPVGPSSVHLLLSGLMGIILGRGIFPAVLVALLLQTVLFGFGGLTTIGVNTVNIALPGAVMGALLGPTIRRSSSPARAAAVAGLGAAACVFATAGLVALCLWLSSSDFVPAARVLAVTYVPLAVAEGAITAGVIAFLLRVQPRALLPNLAAGD